MKSIIYVLYGLYQYIIVWPIMVVLTLFTAVFTILFIPFRNAEFVHKVQQFWSCSFFRLMLLPVTVEGLEHIKPGQSYVFVSNHQSMFDVWLIYGWLPVIFKWLMKAELRKVPFVGTACKAAGHIYVDRKNPKAALESMENVKKQLKDGICTVIFPEGTRTKDGQVGRFKRGAFQIALDLKLPIIPISLSG
jgi:1-acyl-sn-glycerol-3-phosphate acyltransferase